MNRPHGEISTVYDYRVVDGDTLYVACEDRDLRVRLWGIDAPELDQDGGSESAETLDEILTREVKEGGVLKLEIFAFDEYGRAVGLLFSNGQGRLRSVNIEMLSAGYAHCSRWKQGEYFRQNMGFYEAERRAKSDRIGIWALEGAVPPWMHRKLSHERSLHDWATETRPMARSFPSPVKATLEQSQDRRTADREPLGAFGVVILVFPFVLIGVVALSVGSLLISVFENFGVAGIGIALLVAAILALLALAKRAGSRGRSSRRRRGIYGSSRRRRPLW